MEGGKDEVNGAGRLGAQSSLKRDDQNNSGNMQMAVQHLKNETFDCCDTHSNFP